MRKTIGICLAVLVALSTCCASLHRNNRPIMPRIYYPKPDTVVTSPFGVYGIVHPGWLSEGVCPIILKDADGNVLAEENVWGDWQSPGRYTDFHASISFANPKIATGTLTIMQDCPSGECPHIQSFSIPVRFR